MNCLPALRGHICGMLKGFNTPATNSRGNTSIAEVLVFPPEVSGNGTTLFYAYTNTGLQDLIAADKAMLDQWSDKWRGEELRRYVRFGLGK